ncbi:MAG: xanthine dehydrogenase family protein molybdopterin-binding subunit [Syntrophorhabdaceae bacterium]|nr:xanthine dehydrogenase family protein molybdopterin-binding subunit [Syntrophorhabdaceae bacterium]
MKTPISRRDFIKGVLGTAGLTIAASVSPFDYKILSAAEVGKADFEPNAFVKVTPDNKVTVMIPNSEMGQGAWTALGMLVADEIDADWKQVKIKQAPADDMYKSPVFGAQITVGSSSCRAFYEPMRKAGAAARTMLIKAAAKTWNVPEEECEASNGFVVHKKSKKKLPYGKLCKAAGELPLPKDIVLKKESEFKYIGKPMKRLDIPQKVAGTGIYGYDVTLPGMLYAVTARPPAYGAKPVSYDKKAAEAIKGVVSVIETPNGVAVIADSTATALKGRDALKVQWSEGTHPQISTETIEKHYMEGLDKPGAVAKNTGDAKKALSEAAKKVEAIYYVPFVAHACMEPMNCTAYVQKDKCEIWVPTQAQTLTLVTASKLTGLPPDKIVVNTTLVGCGLGRRARGDFVVDAVVASKAVGKPVKALWMREDDLMHDAFRANTCQRIQAGLDDQGNLLGWHHKVSCTSILRFSNPAAIRNGVDIYSLWGIVDWEKTPVFSHTAYEIPNFYVEQYLSDWPMPAAPWRSVQNAPNCFIMESFMDELAHAAKKDPVEFRLALLKNNFRASRVLKTVAEKAGYGKPMPKGKGRGIAQHTCFGTYIAMVADVTVDENTGKIKVDKITAAVDCGPVINPAPIEKQIQGGIIMALSTIFKEKVEFDKGGVKSLNFDSYKILRMSEIPEAIEVHVIKSTEKIGGIGELGVPTVAPAIGNAVFNATGARVRRLPMDTKTVLAALKNR